MKLRWSHVFLVLAVPWVSECQYINTSIPNSRTQEWTTSSLSSSLTTPLQDATVLNTMDNETTVDAAGEDDNGTSTLAPVRKSSDVWEHVSMVTTQTKHPVVNEDQRSSPWAYILLAIIIIAIFTLCFILFHLRKVSRTYSFDLHRQDPVNSQFVQHIGSFEPIYLDDLEQPSLKGEVSTCDQPPGPTANGTSSQAHEKVLMGENGTKSNHGACTEISEEHPDSNSPDTSSDTGPDRELSMKSSGSEKSEKQFLDGTEQQNENNNNPSVCCHDMFVEINLDEPAWCDQLLSSPEPSSNSVLPLSPFSFHSSSSTSSSSS